MECDYRLERKLYGFLEFGLKINRNLYAMTVTAILSTRARVYFFQTACVI